MAVSIVIAGVGGQGSVLASRIIADAALKEREQSPAAETMRVRVGETFGAAMRGGAVSSQVRIGDVHSPLVAEGGADLIVGLEPLETLRVAVRLLRPGGVVVLNKTAVEPTDVKVGMAAYPEIERIESALRAMGATVLAFEATSLAEKAGTVRCMNVIMLGAAFAAGKLPFSWESLVGGVTSRVPPRYLEVNLAALETGRREAQALLGVQKEARA